MAHAHTQVGWRLRVCLRGWLVDLSICFLTSWRVRYLRLEGDRVGPKPYPTIEMKGISLGTVGSVAEDYADLRSTTEKRGVGHWKIWQQCKVKRNLLPKAYTKNFPHREIAGRKYGGEAWRWREMAGRWDRRPSAERLLYASRSGNTLYLRLVFCGRWRKTFPQICVFFFSHFCGKPALNFPFFFLTLIRTRTIWGMPSNTPLRCSPSFALPGFPLINITNYVISIQRFHFFILVMIEM